MRTIEYSDISIPVSGKFVSIAPGKPFLFIKAVFKRIINLYRNDSIQDGVSKLNRDKIIEESKKTLYEYKIKNPYL